MPNQLQDQPLPFVKIHGLMGMASFTEDTVTVRDELRLLKQLFDKRRNNYFSSFDTLSMVMSGDYAIALGRRQYDGTYREPDFWRKNILINKNAFTFYGKSV